MRDQMYRESYPPVGDGTGPDDEDAHDAFLTIRDLEKHGYLVLVEVDYEAAIDEWAKAHDGFRQGIRDIIDAALGIGGDDER